MKNEENRIQNGLLIRMFGEAVMILLALLCGFSLRVCAANPDTDIFIIHTNDIHCGIEDNIGYAGVKLFEEELKTASPYVTLVDAGDAVQGAPVGTLSNGEFIVDIMNEMGYDVIVPGNHEYDYGMDQFMHLDYLQDTDYVCCNFLDRYGKLVFAPYRMITYGDTKVAYIGITTPETLSKASPAFFQDENGNFIYSFCEDETGERLYAAVQNAVNEARQDGADFVIAVGHVGENYVKDIWSSDAIVAHTTGIDAFISGHSHELTQKKTPNAEGKEIIIAQTGTKLQTFGWLDIHPDGSISSGLVDAVPEPSAAMMAFPGVADYIVTEDGRYQDGGINRYIQGIKEQYEEVMRQPIGQTDFDLVATGADGDWLVRNQETNLGDLLADSLRTETGAEIGFVNGGGIRATIPAGIITYNDVYTVQPFGNMICVAEVTGQQIRDLLERGVASWPSQNGEFLHVSGITFTVDTRIPSSVLTDVQDVFQGVRGEYRVQSILVNGEPLDLNRVYTVAGYDYYIKEGGDGGIISKNCNIIGDDVVADVDCVADYIRSFGNGIPEEYRNPAGQGRIIFTGG